MVEIGKDNKKAELTWGKDGYLIVFIQNIRKAIEMIHKIGNGSIVIREDISKRAGLNAPMLTKFSNPVKIELGLAKSSCNHLWDFKYATQ